MTDDREFAADIVALGAMAARYHDPNTSDEEKDLIGGGAQLVADKLRAENPES